jgi:hypothetical protein
MSLVEIADRDRSLLRVEERGAPTRYQAFDAA